MGLWGVNRNVTIEHLNLRVGPTDPSGSIAAGDRNWNLFFRSGLQKRLHFGGRPVIGLVRLEKRSSRIIFACCGEISEIESQWIEVLQIDEVRKNCFTDFTLDSK